MIFIADVTPTYIWPEPDGMLYRYFFWDAYYKGLLLPHPARDEQLRQPPADTSALSLPDPREVRRGARLDSLFYFNDLWNTLAYTTVATVWNPLAGMRGSFYTPKQEFDDLDAGALPLDQRPVNDDARPAILRELIRDGCKQRTDGTWVADENSPVLTKFKHLAQACFPAPLRSRMLILVAHLNPVCENQLLTDEKNRLSALSEGSIKILQSCGISAMDIEKDFSRDDFADVVHLSASGGAKLAAAVAAEVRSIAGRLGYIP